MAHRQPFGSQMSERDHSHRWDNQNEDDQLLLGTAAGYDHVVSLDGIPASSINSIAHSNILSGQNGQSLSTFASESSVRPSSSRILQNPCLGLPFSSDSSSRFQSDHILHEAYYNGHTTGNRNNIVTSEMNLEATTFKRKHPAMPHTFNRENASGSYSAASGYYSAGVSSNLYVPSNPLRPSPISGLQWGSTDPNITSSDHWSDNYLAAREGIQRNMRSQQNHVLPLETGLVGMHSSRNVRRHFHSTVGPSVEAQCSYYTEPIAPHRRNVSSVGPSLEAQCSYYPEPIAPHRRNVSSVDTSLEAQHSYYPEPIAPHRRPVSNHQNMSFDSVTFEDAGPSRVAAIASSGQSQSLHTVGRRSERNMDPAMPTLRFGSTRGMQLDHSYDQRPLLYGPVSNHQNMSLDSVTFEDAGPSRVAAIASSGQSQSLHTVGRRSERNMDAAMPTLRFGSTRGMQLDHSYDQRPLLYGPVSNHPNMSFDSVTFEDAGPSRVAAIASSGQSQSLPTVGRRSERNMDATMPTLHFGSTRGMQLDHSSYDQRPLLYGPVSNHQNMSFDSVTFEDTGPSRVAATASSGQSQSLPTVGRSERNMDATMPTPRIGSTRGMQLDHSSYDQRPLLYGPVSNHQNMSFDLVTFEDAASSRVAAIVSSGQSQSLPTVGRRSERNGRGRNFSSRLQLPYERNAFSSWLPEGFMMLDAMINYDTITFFDEHHSMRLDIDDMGYEELLALEESIGNVSTGLSGDSISRCLMEMTYSSSDRQVDDEEKCAVCLEDYCDGEKLGTLRCEHDFHARCIKEWLLTKNICPVCKVSALTETKKEKQIMDF